MGLGRVSDARGRETSTRDNCRRRHDEADCGNASPRIDSLRVGEGLLQWFHAHGHGTSHVVQGDRPIKGSSLIKGSIESPARRSGDLGLSMTECSRVVIAWTVRRAHTPDLRGTIVVPGLGTIVRASAERSSFLALGIIVLAWNHRPSCSGNHRPSVAGNHCPSVESSSVVSWESLS
jgi:hypothetical protein